MGHEDKSESVGHAPSDQAGWASGMTGQGHAHLTEHITGIPSQVGMQSAQGMQGVQSMGPQEPQGMQGTQNMYGVQGPQGMQSPRMDGWGMPPTGAQPVGNVNGGQAPGIPGGVSHSAPAGYGGMEVPYGYSPQVQQGGSACGQGGSGETQGEEHDCAGSGRSGQASGMQGQGFMGQGGPSYAHGYPPQAYAMGPYGQGAPGMQGAMYGFQAPALGPRTAGYAPAWPAPSRGAFVPHGPGTEGHHPYRTPHMGPMPQGQGTAHTAPMPQMPRMTHTPHTAQGGAKDSCGCSGAPSPSHGFAHQYGELYGLIQEAANGQPDVGRFLNFFHTVSSDFWKGALVGTALTLLLTNDQVKTLLGRSFAGLWGMVGGSAEEREAEEDRKAEQQAAREMDA